MTSTRTGTATRTRALTAPKTACRAADREEPYRSSIMDSQYDATEFCSDAEADHHHYYLTEQDYEHDGESCWQTLERMHSDRPAGALDPDLPRRPRTPSCPARTASLSRRG